MSDFDECLTKMKAPGDKRPSIWRQGVLQVWVTRACDKACHGCTQGSNLAGKPGMMTVAQYGQALDSLKGYFGVVGMFGGNPATHPRFEELCQMLRAKVPWEQRGLWCNHPQGKAGTCRITFNPAVSNLNVHQDQEAFDQFSRDWPECRPHLKGLTTDSRHSPPFVGMRDLGVPEAELWELVSRCDVNQFWSALLGVFRGQLRAWFCEVAAAQAMLHQDEPNYPDTGLDPTMGHEMFTAPGERLEKMLGAWWQLPMTAFAHQVKQHCPNCGVPLRGHGELANAPDGVEQVSAAHQGIYRPKVKGRRVELVLVREQLREGRLPKATDYLENAKR